jgi:short subunit dehydrogenase-like uncharacterized protein
MKIAVNGATGYTGRLAVAELRRRDIDTVLVGRDVARLQALAFHGAEVRVADIGDPAALVEAFAGCDAVVNTAGPFTVLGAPVIEAAIAAGAHYVDTTGEQRYLRRVFDDYAEVARQAGVTVVPALADDGGPGDWIAHLTAECIPHVEKLTIADLRSGGGASRGTMASAAYIAGETLRYENGEWSVDTSREQGRMAIPGEPADYPVVAFALPGVVTVPRHVRATVVNAVIREEMANAFASITTELAQAAPDGPTEDQRRAGHWAMTATAVGARGQISRGFARGTDPYGSTAVIAVEGARRLVEDGAKAGVLAPSQAFDPADFLDFLQPYGVQWSIE